MKTFRTKLKISLTLALAFSALSVWAKPIAQIQEVRGLAFVITPNGTTKRIQAQDLIDERAEILVEEGTQVSLNDYYNTTYHLTGGTHMKFFDRSIQLKKGKTWVKAGSRVPLSMTTANGNVEYTAGQFIATFNQTNNRSQILVVQGDVDVTNILDKDLRHTVGQGNFTVIDPEVDDGIPRVPTKVGMASLNSALKEFEMPTAAPVPTQRPSRSLASVRQLETPMQMKKGEIIFITTTELPRPVRAPASVKPQKKTSWGPAKISYYGHKQELPKKFSRIPASSAQSEVQVQRILKKTPEVRPVYSNDLESLINELKSYQKGQECLESDFLSY